MKVSIDMGYAQTKLYAGSKQCIIPSATAKPASLSADIGGQIAGKYVLADQTLIVGEGAFGPGLQQTNQRDLSWLIANAPFLALAVCDTAGINPADVEKMGCGLPFANMDAVPYMEIALRQVFPSATIDIYPQAVGALLAFCAENASTVRNDDKGLLIDIGGNTILALGHDGYKPSAAGSHQFDQKGVLMCSTHFSHAIAPMINNVVVSPMKAEQAMKDGYIRASAKGRIDITEQAKIARLNYSTEVLTILFEHYRDFVNDLDNIIFTGGGANLLRDHIPSEWKHIAKFTADPEFANARGYFLALDL